MKQVIVKCKITDRDNFEDKLSDIDLDFGPIYWQHDRVYVPRGYRRAQNLPRLIMRTTMHAVDEPPKYALILRRHIEDSGIDIVEETPVQDYATTVNIILQLGFKPAGEVSRRRQELSMGEGTNIYLDQLDSAPGIAPTTEADFPAYAKIETPLTEGDSAIAAKTDLLKTFHSLGEEEIVESAYFEL